MCDTAGIGSDLFNCSTRMAQLLHQGLLFVLTAMFVCTSTHNGLYDISRVGFV